MGQNKHNLKIWLQSYQEHKRDTDRLWERADEFRARISAAHAPIVDGMPHEQRTDGDRIGAALAQLEEIEAEARASQEVTTAIRREIEGAIRKIRGSGWANKRELLRLRYLDGLRWEDIAEKFHGDDPRFWDEPDSFLRRAFKLHSQAMEELEKLVPLQTGQENSTLED